MTRSSGLSAFILFLATQTLAQNAHQFLRSGDKDYVEEHYDAAEQAYQHAARQNPGSGNTIYNLGCALYQQGKFPEAEKSFQQADLANQPPDARADVLYNLGNARLKQRKYREAIEAYENSLRLRPGDAAAKQNLQMAKQKLEEQKKEEQKQQKKQDPNAGQQPPEDQQPQQDQPQDKPEQNQRQDQPKNAGQKPNQAQQEPGSADPGKMTRQEAQRLLETTIGPEDRKSARKYRATVRKTLPKDRQKDW